MLLKFFSYYKPHKKLFVIDTVCSFLVAVCNLAYPYIAGDIIAEINNGLMDWSFILIWSGVLLGIYIIKALLNYVIQYWGHIMGIRIQGDMRREFFGHLQRMPFSFFDENKTGTIMSRLINDLFEISEFAHHGPEDLFLSLITLIGALVMVCFINPWLSLIILCIVPFMCWFAIVQRKRMMASYTEMRKQTGEINAEVESAVTGIRISRAYTATEHELDKFDVANVRFQDARAKAYEAMGVFNSGMGLFADILYLAGILSGGLFYYFKLITVDGLASFILYITMIISPIRTFAAIFESIQSGMTGFKRCYDIMQMPTEEENSDAVEVGKLKGNIKFDNVSFSYNNDRSDYLVLDNVSFEVSAGHTVALVGPSGGGKTTMCHLIPRFYEIDGGTISIDGYDITKLTRYSLRKNIGIVQQDVFLFGGSIRENIAYGNLDASEEEIIEAAKNANIHDYVMSLPDGYDTEVGERGIKLSGGQKQRISIARAFLKNPPILILDEATSALDNVTELQIQQSLEQLSEGRTTIVVAHRLSTIKNADEIMVVTKEGIAERGTHEQLMQLNGMYADLYNKQFKC